MAEIPPPRPRKPSFAERQSAELEAFKEKIMAYIYKLYPDLKPRPRSLPGGPSTKSLQSRTKVSGRDLLSRDLLSRLEHYKPEERLEE